jgi:hypothetical protein
MMNPETGKRLARPNPAEEMFAAVQSDDTLCSSR